MVSFLYWPNQEGGAGNASADFVRNIKPCQYLPKVHPLMKCQTRWRKSALYGLLRKFIMRKYRG